MLAPCQQLGAAPAQRAAERTKKAVPAREQQTGDDASADDEALSIFKKRILPIFEAKKPSSCTECHLSGVELSDYIQPNQADTFASLVRAELIDVNSPDDSKLLQFIRRRPEQPSLINETVRKQELQAFQVWIRAAVADETVRGAITTKPSGPQIPVEVIRHARKDRVLASFNDNIWTEVGRCAACHSPANNQKQVEEHGEHVSWIIPNDPQATLDHMLTAGIINTDAPLESRLLTKPTLQVEHGGGQKMVVGDRTYKQFRTFIDDYTNVVQATYTTAAALPKPNAETSLVSDTWLKLTDVPAKYDQMLLQADVYRWTDAGWSEFRVASSDRPVFGGGSLWQHSLSLTAPRGSRWAAAMQSKQLPAGRYLVKIYIDRAGKLQQDYQAELGDEDFVGEVEFESPWTPGYGHMTVIPFPVE